jgi:hypothetical protein
MGSSVPVWPTFTLLPAASLKERRAIATTLKLDIPSGLSINRYPSTEYKYKRSNCYSVPLLPGGVYGGGITTPWGVVIGGGTLGGGANGGGAGGAISICDGG